MKNFNPFNYPFIARNLVYFQVAEVVVVLASLAFGIWGVLVVTHTI